MPDPFDFDDVPAPQPEPPVRLPDLDVLNETQRQAVEAIDGPVLVLAGAGTGKTRVLTTRLAQILATGKARPWQVLAVTFTNKAAREMRERVAALLGCAVERWWVGTFHAVGARITVRTGSLVRIHDVIPVTGYLSQADPRAHFSLAGAKAADSVEIRWPDGRTTRMRNVRANQLLEVVQEPK